MLFSKSLPWKRKFSLHLVAITRHSSPWVRRRCCSGDPAILAILISGTRRWFDHGLISSSNHLQKKFSNKNNKNLTFMSSALQRTQRFSCSCLCSHQTMQLCGMAAANQHQLHHSNTQKRTYWLGKRWLFHGSFAQVANGDSGSLNRLCRWSTLSLGTSNYSNNATWL